MPEDVAAQIPQSPRTESLKGNTITINAQKLETPETKEREGLGVNFTINNRYLIAHTLSSMDEEGFHSTKYQPDVINLQNHAWELSQRDYDFVTGRLTSEQFFDQGGSLQEIDDYLGKLEQSQQFGVIRQQTEESLQTVRAEWERNYPQTSKLIEELTGLDLNKEITVLMVHPNLKNGMYLGNDTLAWSHRQDWTNYNTIYLWHEIMHSYFDMTDLSHALIQLVSDNELRVRLNEGETYPPFEGHENLIPLMDKLLPYWQTYLAETPESGKRDVMTFEERLRTMPEFQEKSEEETPSQIIE